MRYARIYRPCSDTYLSFMLPHTMADQYEAFDYVSKEFPGWTFLIAHTEKPKGIL